MTSENKIYLQNYVGDNPFILSLKKGFEKYGSLTPKQIYALNRFINNEDKQKGKEQMQMMKEKAPEKEIDKNILEIEEKEIAPKQESLFSIESLEEETKSPLLEQKDLNVSDLEERLNVLAGRVVEDTMRQASKKLDAIVEKANRLANQKTVMHIKLSEMPVVKLSSEAHELLPKLIVSAKAGFNTLLVGPAGCGKTTLAAQVSESLALRFGHLCLSAGVSETWLYGRQLPSGIQEGEFSNFYRNGGVFLLDEFDAADSNLLLSINTALANGHLYNPILGEKIPRHKDFVCIAAANTFGLGGNAQYTGRNRLDAATLDRFLQFEIKYNTKLEEKLCPDKKLCKVLFKAREKLAERNATQVISTRAFDRGYRLLNSGFTQKDILETITLSWPKGLAQEIGLSHEANEEIPF